MIFKEVAQSFGVKLFVFRFVFSIDMITENENASLQVMNWLREFFFDVNEPGNIF